MSDSKITVTWDGSKLKDWKRESKGKIMKKLELESALEVINLVIQDKEAAYIYDHEETIRDALQLALDVTNGKRLFDKGNIFDASDLSTYTTEEKGRVSSIGVDVLVERPLTVNRWNKNMSEAPRDGSPFIGMDSMGETHIAHLFTAPADNDSPETYAFLEYHGATDLDLIKWMHIPKEDE